MECGKTSIETSDENICVLCFSYWISGKLQKDFKKKKIFLNGSQKRLLDLENSQ